MIESEEDNPPIPPKKCTKKKVQKDWTDLEINMLIDNVELHPSLWNKAVDEYHDKTARDAAWREIVDVFQDKVHIDEIIAKWNNLRIQFKGYLAKTKKKTSGQASIHEVHWRFYHKLLFLKAADVEQTISTDSNFVINDETSSVDTVDSHELPQCSNSSVPNKKQRVSRTPSTSSSTDSTRQVAIDAMHTAIKKMNEEPKCDEFQIFGNFVASELRKIPNLNDAHRIQRNMQRVLLDYMDQLDEEQRRKTQDLEEQAHVSRFTYVDSMGNEIDSEMVKQLMSNSSKED